MTRSGLISEPKIKTNTGNELGELSFFGSFPKSLLDKLSDTTETVELPEGTEILKQGQYNTKLYFLMLGSVSVIVDGGVVARLDQMGDLLGEMSVIRNTPVSATIVADTPVELLAVDAQKLAELSGDDSGQMQSTLYRVYAHILTEKLDGTNQKAKHFEELSYELQEAQEKLQSINAQLEIKVAERTADLQQKTKDLTASHKKLEAQNDELVASYKKMEELYSNRDLTFEKLEELYKDHFVSLKFTLSDLKSRVDDKSKTYIGAAEAEVDSVMNFLEPITNRFILERSMKSKRVLLAEPLRKRQVTAKLALGGTGVELAVASSMDEAKDFIAQQPFDIVFVNSETVDLVDEVRQSLPNARVVFMTSDDIPSYLPKLKGLEKLPIVVSTDESDRTFTIKNIMTTVAKLTSRDIFGLDKYLAWGVDVQMASVTNSEERGQLIESMNEYFSNSGMRKSNVGRATLVAEELLMNAIYDAPRGSDGKSLYNHLSRSEKIQLAPEHHATLRYASDGLLMAVSVEDPNGGLSGEIILDYLDSCYGGREGTLNSDKGGAGRGLHQIIENSDLVVFNLLPNKRTEVIALFNVDPKAAGDKHPSFHLFKLPS